MITIDSPELMGDFGRFVAGHLRQGDVLCLTGELGAGKTTFTRGLGDALNVRGSVTSPTFVIARTHSRDDGPALVHVDAYRLASAAELDDVDIDWDNSIAVVEWGSGKIDSLVDDWLEIVFERSVSDSDDDRSIRLVPHGVRARDIADQIGQWAA